MANDVSSDGTVYAGDNNYGVYKSVDSGVAFTKIFTIPTQPNNWGYMAGRVWMVFVDSRDYIFVSAGGTNRLYRSTDGGAPFTEVFVLPGRETYAEGHIMSMTEDADGNLYAAEYADRPPARLWKSTDGGQTWTCLRTWSARHLHYVKFNPHNGWLYVVVGEDYYGTETEYQTVWRSKDGGNSWQCIVERGPGWTTKYFPLEFIGNDVYIGHDRLNDYDYIFKITDDGGGPYTPVKVYDNPYPYAIFVSATKLGDTIIFATCSESYDPATCQVVMSNDGVNWTVLNAQTVSTANRYLNILTVHPRKGIVYGCINVNYCYFIADPSTPRPPSLQPPLNTAFLEGRCKTDFGDVRFTASDGVTLLDYWMEAKVDGEYAVFWVKINDDLSTNPTTIYVYYGNPSATTISNGENTFLFFDEFDSNLNKWIGVCGTDTWTIEDGMLTIQPTDNHNYLIANQEVGTNGIALMAKIKSVQAGSQAQAHPGLIWHANMLTGLNHKNDQVYFRPHDTSPSSTMGNIQPAYYIGTGGSYNTGLVFHSAKAGSYYTWNNWYTIEVGIPPSGNIKLYGNNIYWHEWSIQQYSFTYVGLVAHAYGKNYFDYFAVRKFVDPEPTHSVWGEEEEAFAPTAQFTYTPIEPKAGETVTFDASGSLPNGGAIIEYYWDFGDNTSVQVTEPITTHIYVAHGTYKVALTVTDNQGLNDTTWQWITVLPSEFYLHDIAVSEVIAAPAMVEIGDTVEIRVTVKNLGNATETFNLTTKYGTITQVEEIVELQPEENRTFTYHWDTSNEQPCFHTISSLAGPVEGETYIWNNFRSAVVQIVTLIPEPAKLKIEPALAKGLREFNINVTINDLDAYWDMAGFDITLHYNTTLLDVVDVELSKFAINFNLTYRVIEEINDEKGYVQMAYMWDIVHLSPEERPTPYGSGVLFAIRFKAVEEGDDLITFGDVWLAAFPNSTKWCFESSISISYSTESAVVKTRFPWKQDVNADGKIDILDVIVAAAAYASRPGDPGWNPYADLDQDGKVTILDLISITRVYGAVYDP